MGFPDTYRIPVSDTQAYKQFGNSIVVPVVAAVARHMEPHLGLPIALDPIDELHLADPTEPVRPGYRGGGLRGRRGPAPGLTYAPPAVGVLRRRGRQDSQHGRDQPAGVQPARVQRGEGR